jgi:hypothetical protein
MKNEQIDEAGRLHGIDAANEVAGCVVQLHEEVGDEIYNGTTCPECKGPVEYIGGMLRCSCQR